MIFKWFFALIIRIIQLVAFVVWGFLFITGIGEGASGGALFITFAVGFVVINLLQWFHMRLKRPPPPVERSLDDYPLPDDHRR